MYYWAARASLPLPWGCSSDESGDVITPMEQILSWPSWFAPQEKAKTVIRDLCLQSIEFQFRSTGKLLKFQYTRMLGAKDENGVRRQKTRHERVFQKIVDEFEKRNEQFKKPRGMVGGEIARLTEGIQSLQI